MAMLEVARPLTMRGDPGTNELADAPDRVELWRRVMARLVGAGDVPASAGIAAYRALFAAAFPEVRDAGDLSFAHAARALAAFIVSAFTALDSPFDRYLAGNPVGLGERQRRGALLFFGKARCVRCHSGPLLSDGRFHALAVPQVGPGTGASGGDAGRAEVTGRVEDTGLFRTPALRNVALTGPWMHDGAFSSLEATVRHHLDPAASLGGYEASRDVPVIASCSPALDPDPARSVARALARLDPILAPPISLTEEETRAIVEFLNALTDRASIWRPPALPAEVPSGLPVGDGP
jgi:cytochrome c peroxidase